LLIKADIDGEDWIIMDDARTPVNPVNDAFFANNGTVPTAISAYNVDFNDDGFTVNNTNPRFNTNTATYYYMAIAGRKPSDPGPDAFKVLETLNTKDHSSSAHSVTNNGASFQTSVKKFYDGAAQFQSGSALTLATSSNTDFKFGTGDFTVESWVHQTATNTYPSLLEIGNHLSVSGLVFIVGASTRIYSDGFFGTAAMQLNTWNHVAFCRAGGVLTIYINGSPQSSVAFTRNLTDVTKGTIGKSHQITTSNYWFPGYIQDLSVYKGIAKYTSSFSPPERSIQGTARRYPSGVYVVS
jgi:hypothetical protein